MNYTEMAWDTAEIDESMDEKEILEVVAHAFALLVCKEAEKRRAKKRMLPVRVAAPLVGYTHAHLTGLIRDGRLPGYTKPTLCDDGQHRLTTFVDPVAARVWAGMTIGEKRALGKKQDAVVY